MRADDDRELVDRCVARRPGAWRLFVDRFAPTVRGLANRYLRLNGQFPDGGLVDDVVQDVFKALIRRDYRLLRNYDPTFSFKTYLGVITRTEVHRMLRKRRRVAGQIEDLESEVSTEAGAEEEAERAEEKEALTRALDSLPERDAQILRLRFLQERDYKTIAGILEIPESSVGQTLYRAKKRLLEKLKTLLGLLV